MRMSVCAPIVDFKNTQILHPDGSKATFRSLCVECLSAHIQSLDSGKEFKYYMSLYELAKKISDAEFVDLNVEELSLLKNRVTATQYNNVVKGRIYEMIEGTTKAQECSNG